jgi:outer membrane protein assembly factor BamA
MFYLFPIHGMDRRYNSLAVGVGLENKQLNGNSNSVSTGATVILDNSLKLASTFESRLSNATSFSYTFEYTSYSKPRSLTTQNLDSKLNYLSHDLHLNFNFMNAFFTSFGIKKKNEYYFTMSSVKANFNNVNMYGATADVGLKGLTAIGNLVIGHQFYYIVSSNFPSAYQNPKVFGTRLYINLDILKNGIFGIAYYNDREISNGSYAHTINSQSLMGHFYFGM